MFQTPARNQIALFNQGLDHGFIGIALVAFFGNDALAFKAGGFLGVETVIINGEGDAGINPALGQGAAIGHPDFKVFTPMRRGRMDKACARIIGDMIPIQQRHLEFIAQCTERVGAEALSQNISRNCVPMGQANFSSPCNGIRQFMGKDIALADFRTKIALIGGDFIKSVFNFMRIGDGAVAGQGPRGGGPDDNMGALQRAILNRKFHPDHIALMIVIFDLGFGQSGFFHHRPHHGLGAAIEQTIILEFHDLAGDLCFRMKGHG